jgi:hypothetical protein
MAIIGVNDQPTERTTTLRLFVALPAYTPGQL